MSDLLDIVAMQHVWFWQMDHWIINHWILRHLIRSVKLKSWPEGHEAIFAATSDGLSSHSTKDGKATDSWLGLISVAYTSIHCWMIWEVITGYRKQGFVPPWPWFQFYWGGDHWWPRIGLHAPLAMVSVLLTWSGGIIFIYSICHKSLTLGNV